MAEVIVSIAFDKLDSMLRQEKEQGLRLVVCVDEEFRKFTKNMLAIRDVLEDAESRQVRDAAVGDWLNKLKNTFFDIEETFDEWTTALQKLQIKEVENASNPIRKVCSSIHSYFFCNRRVLLHGDIALKIKYLNKTVDDVTMEKDKFNFKLVKSTRELTGKMTTAFIDITSKVYGRDQDKNKIVNLLLSDSSQGTTLPIISIVGSEGIGKTTLARLVFDDKEVSTHFDKRIWVCASPFSKIRVAKTILESQKNDVSNLVDLEIILQHIRQYVKEKKFLLVLDDVDTKDDKYWKLLNYALKCGSEGSRILVTSCDENIVGKSNVISLKTLSKEDCWSLFSEIALFESNNDKEGKKLEEIGQEILSKCSGLPLAVKILGSLLRFKRNVEEWQSVLANEIWKLEVKEIGPLFPLLLLCYYDLPSIIRKCFSYCAIFSKNYEIEKERLIKLWMSQNYLIKMDEKSEDIELIGEEYFDNLVKRSIFQDFQRNEYDGRIISCKIHNIVNNFAKFLTKNECFPIEVNGSRQHESEPFHENVQHLMITFEGGNSFPNDVYDKKRLRSLVVEPRGGFMTNVVLTKLFDELTCLRALDMGNQDNFFYKLIKKVPREIEKLIYLRYLNLSKNKRIKELPDTLCELCNLQTLDVNWCINLKILPQGIGKLINLRHILNNGSSLSYLPKGIERLTLLQTLSEFIVSGTGGNGSKACTIESLMHLSHLRGSLIIKKLGNIKDFGNIKAVLRKDKESLLDLSLCFKTEQEIRTMDDDQDEMVLEALQAPPNLLRLKIFYYRSKVMPFSWILSLTKLRFLSLDHCINLEHLPALGKLPSLETLIIRRFKIVERVGDEFLGLESTYGQSSSVAFPKLKHLKFQDMKGWKEWNSKKEEDVKIMPCIDSLTIAFCPKLETLPNYISELKTLKELNIISRHVPNDQEPLKKVIETMWSENPHLPDVKFSCLQFMQTDSYR